MSLRNVAGDIRDGGKDSAEKVFTLPVAFGLKTNIPYIYPSYLVATSIIWVYIGEILGTFNAISAALPYLRNSDFPPITVVGILVASFGFASSELAYTTSKGAVKAMVKEMAFLLAHNRIRVDCVSPGLLAGGFFPTYPVSIGEKTV